MKGWLVVNHFIRSAKFDLIYDWLEQAAADRGIRLQRMTNAQLMSIIGGSGPDGRSDKSAEQPDFVIFWDKDVRLARYLEAKGLRLFNNARAIELCDDKALTHISLARSGIRMPKTIIAPMTYETVGYNGYEFLEVVMDELGFPVVVKECFGSFGQQVYLAGDREELFDITRKIGTKPMLFQEFITTSKGRDVRINVVGSEPVAAMERVSDKNFRANITIGGRMKAYKPSLDQVETAIKVCRHLDLDFAGVDILFGEDDEPVLCEVNSSAHFKSVYDCTGVNVADFIMDHISRMLGR